MNEDTNEMKHVHGHGGGRLGALKCGVTYQRCLTIRL